MTSTGLQAFQEYAERAQVQTVAQWGRLTILDRGPVNLDEIRHLVETYDLTVIARFGSDLDVEFPLSTSPPSDAELSDLQRLVMSETERLQLLDPADAWVAARVAYSVLTKIELRYERSNWCVSLEVLSSSLESDWMRVADSLVDGDITVGSVTLSLRSIDRHSPYLILEPVEERPTLDALRREVWDAIISIADAAAWRNIATAETRSGGSLLISLHHDQPAVIELDPSRSIAGLALWKWLIASDDPNRDAALRHVLRLATVASNTLPSGSSVLVLAERYRIALSRDQAAEVERTISESRTRTAAGLGEAKKSLAVYVEDSVKTAQGTVIAAIGVVALAARGIELIPDLLLILVMAAALIGIVAVLVIRWRRLSDLATDIENLKFGLSEEQSPLLPASERDVLLRGVRDYDADRRIRNGRIGISILGILAASIVLATGMWILLRNTDASVDDGTVDAEPVTEIRDDPGSTTTVP